MFLLLLSLVAYAQDFVFSGKVVDRKTSEPVEFATVVLESTGQWAIADAKGYFEIKGVRACKTDVIVSSLGYVEDSREITIARSITNYTVYLNVDNLALEGALVTAQDNSNSATTSRLIDKNALNHVQMLNISDITSLLPGGVTSNPSLLTEHNITIRSGGSGEAGNALFGAAIEVDGARLSNNGSFGNADLTGVNLRGVSTNNIASSNVESVEVISGVASVEYGDMTSGVVKINTQKGKTPYTITMSTTPVNKQVSVGKGFGLKSKDGGKSHGTLNANLEHMRSISEPMSPYTSYSRSQLNLLYSNTFTGGAFGETPLRMSFGVTGNLGGRNDKTDPDRYQDSYTRALDNNLRANLTMDWLLNRKWITNIEFKAGASYSDKSQKSKTYYSSSVTSVSLHGEDRGYFMSEPFSGVAGQKIIQVKPGYYSNVMNWDDRPVYFKASVKANWATTWGKVNSKIKLGADFTGDKNLGRGQYSAEMDTAPSFREYRYDLVPLMFNGAAYLEENLTFPVGKGRMNFIAGIRNDNTVINGSEYGTVSSWSPRFNWKYTVLDAKGRGREALRSLAVKAGWGKTVKLPAFAVLYPRPSFYDIEVFRSTVSSDNTVSSAFFVMPREVEFNRSLRWQNNRQVELGVDFNLYGIKVGLSGYYTTTHDSYRLIPEYEPFSYMYTLTSALSDCPVPAADRVFSISQGGVVTVSDRNGVIPSVQLDAQKRDQFVSGTLIDNDDNPIRRCGLEWTVEFPKIKPVNTTIMLDGNYYDYRSVYTDIKVDCPASTVAANGKLYPYKAYYYGGNSIANGNISRSLRNNLTIVTHIPKVRMIVSLKLEASLLKYSQALSERYDGKQRSYSIADRGDPTSVDTRDIYDGEGYTVMYPDYIVSLDGTRMEFLDKYRWAKDNDKAMYADLSKLVVVSNYKYIFLPEYISPYFSANLSVTKEIGDLASISFYANNFFNNMGQVYSTKTGTYSSVASFKDASAGVMYTYTGQVNAMVAQGAENIFTLTLNRVETKQIIIKELYNTGCPAAGGKSFANDAYVTLYNNSDVEADAGNLVFGVLQPGNAQANNKFYADGGEVLLYENAGWIPAYNAIWFFKGETKIAPYSSLTVAIFGAVDHTATYPESVDLSDPSYYVMAKEGVSQITNSKYQISDNIPAANYLSAYVFNRGNAWVLSTTSPAFFIATMENSALKALLEDTDSFDRTCGNDDIGWAPKFPVANIVDAVEVWAADQVDKSKFRFPASVNVGRVEITSKLGHTAYRNVDKEATEAIAENKGLLVTGYAADPSGIDAEASAAKGAKIVYKDTNNSGTDFHEREKQAIKK